MKINNTDKEQISAFADGELNDEEIGAALSALRDADMCKTWDAYHRIGDILRSEDMAVGMSPGFASKLASRLADEPAIVAPTARQRAVKTNIQRFGLPAGLAAAAVMATAWIAAPQLLVASKDSAKFTSPSVVSVSASVPGSPHSQHVVQTTPEMVRDAHLDEYLLAHQRFSPAMYSTAQYARSATFAADGDK